MSLVAYFAVSLNTSSER